MSETPVDHFQLRQDTLGVVWNLDFGIYLDFGLWDLEFPLRPILPSA